jgi:hypothetical protein
MPLSLDAVLALSQDDLFEIVRRAAPLDLDALADTSYTGIDLSMPASFHKLFWKSFRKTFHRDPATGALRGWNVKVQQTGWDRPPEPKLGPGGTPLSFGHYEVRSARGLKFPPRLDRRALPGLRRRRKPLLRDPGPQRLLPPGLGQPGRQRAAARLGDLQVRPLHAAHRRLLGAQARGPAAPLRHHPPPRHQAPRPARLSEADQPPSVKIAAPAALGA